MKDAADRRQTSRRARPEPAKSAQVLAFPDGASPPDDAALWTMLLEGDSKAPRALWMRFGPMVHRILTRAFGPDHDVADLVQEVFLVLFRRAHTLREPNALRAFIISIAANTVRLELRRKRALSWLRLGETVVVPAPDADLDAREAVRRLYAILDHVGSWDRTVFVLRFIEGLEIPTMAEALGVSQATVKRRLACAWKRVLSRAQRDGALMAYLATAGPEAPP